MDWKESELENDDLKNYKAKAEFYVRQHQDEAAIAKLKGNIPLTSEDVAALERILWSEVGSRQDYESVTISTPSLLAMYFAMFPPPRLPVTHPHGRKAGKIEQTAQAILGARALYPDTSLAGLYDEAAMPPELRKAHQQNGNAVMQAYGFSVRDMTESRYVAELIKMYQRITESRKRCNNALISKCPIQRKRRGEGIGGQMERQS